MLLNHAHGYVNKRSASEDLLDCIETVLSNKRYMSKTLEKELALIQNNAISRKTFSDLSYREQQVFILLAKGNRPIDISRQLKINIKTVSTYKTRIFNYFEFKTITDLILYSAKHQLI